MKLNGMGDSLNCGNIRHFRHSRFPAFVRSRPLARYPSTRPDISPVSRDIRVGQDISLFGKISCERQDILRAARYLASGEISPEPTDILRKGRISCRRRDILPGGTDISPVVRYLADGEISREPRDISRADGYPAKRRDILPSARDILPERQDISPKGEISHRSEISEGPQDI